MRSMRTTRSGRRFRRGIRFGALTLLVGAASLLTTAAAAAPIAVVLTFENRVEGSFEFSALHSADRARETVAVDGMGEVDFFKSGDILGRPITGRLEALQEGERLFDIRGTLDAGGFGSLVVTGGEIDFARSAENSFGGFLEISELGTFAFLDRRFAGAANSFDGTALRLWGNNWATPQGYVGAGSRPLGLDLGAQVTAAVPEPGAVLLFALGGVLVAIHRGRCAPV